MKVFNVVLENLAGEIVKAPYAAKSRQALTKILEGTGEVLKVTDDTEKHKISTAKLAEALETAGFGKAEILLIKLVLAEYAEENIL